MGSQEASHGQPGGEPWVARGRTIGSQEASQGQPGSEPWYQGKRYPPVPCQIFKTYILLRLQQRRATGSQHASHGQPGGKP